MPRLLVEKTTTTKPLSGVSYKCGNNLFVCVFVLFFFFARSYRTVFIYLSLTFSVHIWPRPGFFFSNSSLSLTALITALKFLICNIYIAWHKWVLFVYFCRLLNVLCKNYYKYIIQSNFSGSNIFGTMEICSRWVVQANEI